MVAVDGEGHLVIIGNGKKAVSSIPFMEAKEKPVTAEAVELQLRKTGGTPFFIRSVQMEYDGRAFLPMGVIADTRRAFLITYYSYKLESNKSQELMNYSSLSEIFSI